jgi:hypothetical protein
MDQGSVNFLAIIVAAVVGFGIGPLWYGPLFGRKWMELNGITEQDAEGASALPFVVTFVGFFFLAYAIARIMFWAGYSGAWWGLVTGFFVWILIMAPLMLSQTLYQMGSVRAWWIDAAYRGVAALLMGLIIGVWS